MKNYLQPASYKCFFMSVVERCRAVITPGQEWAKCYVLVHTTTYQNKTVQVSTGFPRLYIPVCTGTYQYVHLRSQVVFQPTQKESGEMR